ncbi:hypothetical protein AB1Y20_013250 [Prymnesium parvum]|uniref:Uncharacterized protein n=1 Tax=Prymnesium parvum TaxID=97485 RepID=A0AB34IKZ4_PRYPA
MAEGELPVELLQAVMGGRISESREELKEELLRLQSMPQVRLLGSSIFDRAMPPGSIAQQRGVAVKLRCCKKTIDHKCNDLEGERACPTHVEAARRLQEKIHQFCLQLTFGFTASMYRSGAITPPLRETKVGGPPAEKGELQHGRATSTRSVVTPLLRDGGPPAERGSAAAAP